MACMSRLWPGAAAGAGSSCAGRKRICPHPAIPPSRTEQPQPRPDHCMTKLSVNVNKIAVLRNSRGGSEPDICRAAQTCIEAGCGGITVHPRPDQRHVRPSDVYALATLLRGRVEYNLEGNPFADARGDYPGLIELARRVRPTQVTLVPDGDGQITSDHGFDLSQDIARLRPVVSELCDLGCRVSLFVDAGSRDFDLASVNGVRRIEIYTGPY